MRFGISELKEKIVIRTWKNKHCTKAIIVNRSDAIKTIDGIKKNEWSIVLDAPIKDEEIIKALL